MSNGQRRSKRPYSTLQRFAQRPAETVQDAQELCELCGEPIRHEHRHLLEVSARKIRCVCRVLDTLRQRGRQSRQVPTNTQPSCFSQTFS
ncbi:MAG: DUF5947 family protein [Chloroflexia bacterium]